MDFTLTFLRVFGITIYIVGPILLLLFFAILALGQIVGRLEKWTILDAFYFSLTTGMTVGFGDLFPGRPWTKLATALIALLGLLCTGIVVAVGLKSVELALNHHYDTAQMIQLFF
jgi:voltage-gated potassium channel